jgi:protein ImuB
VVDGVSRLACVLVEGFAAAALERCEPALRERPLAAVLGAPPATRVVEANARGRAEGIRPGLSDAEAVVRCPTLVRRPVSAEAEAAAHHALLDACLAVSPRIEDVAPGCVHVDLAGLTRLFGDDETLARRLRRQARVVGLEARVGIAATRAAAGVAARVGPGLHVIAPGGERAALAAVPLAALEWPEGVSATFTRWGLATLGDLAALPRDGVGARLGKSGLAAHDLACGIDRGPFRPWSQPPSWEEAQGLDWEIVTLPALMPVLERILERLCARLAAAHMAVDALDLRLALASGGHQARTMALAAPLTEAAPLVALLALELERQPPEAAITGVSVSARVLPRRAALAQLWHPPPPAPRDLAAVLARLALLVGGANVGAPIVLDSHRPDAYSLAPFDPTEPNGLADSTDERATGTAATEQDERIAGPLVLRRLRPPRPVTVETHEGRPAWLHGLSNDRAEVVTCAGPWRASGQWWDTDPWARDEWDIALADGTLWRLAHDRITKSWHLDALYD